jgi:hypothetical protein
MTARKPPGLSWESWIDRLVREAREQGEFDDLPGAGKPIQGLEDPHDELWWVRQLLQREGLSVTPPTLALRKEVEEAFETLALETSEEAVRAIVEDLNVRIRKVNRTPTWGPPSTLMPFDVDEIVEAWRRATGS